MKLTNISNEFIITYVASSTPSIILIAARLGVPPVYTPTAIPATAGERCPRSRKYEPMVATHTATRPIISDISAVLAPQPRKSQAKRMRGRASGMVRLERVS